MERLDSLVDEKTRKAIMTGCACQYPKSDLQTIKATFQETQDLDLVHRMLQNKFEFFLTEELNLDMELIEEVISRGWGLAGLRQGNMIIATKIPKSGYLVEYMNETDPERKRQIYCHCPRVRDALKSSQTIPRTYCYCGAGYYKGIWEEILEKPVQVEVLETVLQGDEVCKIGIHLPPV
jgi:predicted hydrocarbon binding protein